MVEGGRWKREGGGRKDEKNRRRTGNNNGQYADFHSLRHWFITGLARAGVWPKMAQTLARHSDIRLTLDVYTHVELPDRSAAIETLPPPPPCNCNAIIALEKATA